MNSVNGAGSSAAKTQLWRVAILTAAGALGTTTHAEAAMYYWSDYTDGSNYYHQPQSKLERPKPPKRSAVPGKSKKAIAEKETGAKPQGPLVIAISIDRQRMTVYDSNGVYAESPVSTGMKGHPTPMGVFSVIQKHKFHHSNIYSGAPMPFMQRITWSGVAIHAGVLPGYPASHGCIRMPMAFAVKMWNWTRMGARVIVTPGEMTPHSFSHPLLASLRMPPQPAVSLEQPASTVADKADKGAPEAKSPEARAEETKVAEAKSAIAEPAMELRSTVGHAVMSDATIGNAMAREEAPAVKTAPNEDAKSAETTAAVTTEASQATTSEKPADKAGIAKPEAARLEATKPEAAKSEPAKSESAKSEPARPEATEVKKPDVVVTAPTTAQPAADARKDQTRAAEPAQAAKPEPPKRAGQIAVFISRKDSKIYVRQNFAPLFEAPVTIAASDRPLGTHVFTAEADKTDANALHWSVVSLPVAVRSAERDDDRHMTHRQRKAGVIPVAARPVITPDSPAEALDRISIPADTVAKINELLTTGGSIIVSDQGINQGETGEGTDFIVRLR